MENDLGLMRRQNALLLEEVKFLKGELIAARAKYTETYAELRTLKMAKFKVVREEPIGTAIYPKVLTIEVGTAGEEELVRAGYEKAKDGTNWVKVR